MADPHLLKRVPFFTGLEPEALGRLAALFRPSRYRRNEVIFHQGDPGTTLHLITEGMVKVVLPSLEGEERILAFLSVGDYFGELSVLDGQPRSATAVAMEPTATLTLQHADLLAFLRGNPAGAVSTCIVLAGKLRRADALLADVSFHDLPTRLAKRLVELAEQFGQPTPRGVVIQRRVTQQELAAMAGATRARVNQHLRRFEQRGLVELGPPLLILKLGELRQQAA
ncbi:MAG: Crp/Fnr family transcriptional regulator [Chloroflexi bacterium]|nr:Crp/Fnr family transcriptional regulator [Chloroflexota bacterium]